MRLSGLMSGMDTESIIQDLVEVKRKKVDSVKKAQTKLSWKQDAWKDLNKKLRALQSKHISNMRFTSSYSKKTTKVSNSNAVSVLTGENAVNGVQSLEIKQLAKTGYLTGGKVSRTDGAEVTALTKLGDLGITNAGSFSIKTEETYVDINVNADTTISDVLTKLKEAGVNASFDAKQNRFFISAKESGLKNDFSIVAMDHNGDQAMAALGLKTDVNQDASLKAEYEEYANFYQTAAGNRDQILAAVNQDGRITRDLDARVESYLNQYKDHVKAKETAEKEIERIQAKYDASNPLGTVEELQGKIEQNKTEIETLEQRLKDESDTLSADEKKELEEKLKTLKETSQKLSEKKVDAENLLKQQDNVRNCDAKMIEIKSFVDITETAGNDGKIAYSAQASSRLTEELNDRYYQKAVYANEVIHNGAGGQSLGNGATKINGRDALITLNGAEFTNANNSFEINGLTFTALDETKSGEEITVTTQDDVDGIYDMVKNFLKDYNAIINEMDKLYNADAAKGYEPLTEDEKYAMSEKEVEKYEKKIKDSLFHRDDDIASISSSIRAAMSGPVDVNGKQMFLSDFGIECMGYFEAPDNEKNAYHIAGDPDDTNTSNKPDVLKSMISNDPETVISFFSGLAQNIHEEMDGMTKSVDGYRSFGSFYDDKKMKEDYNDYKKEIAELEKKLNAYEDRWYAKFSKMETAMAKLQKNTSAITSLIGGGF